MHSPFPWPGGKRNSKKTLLGMIPPHRLYVEPFAGSAKLLFAKEPSEREVLNDLNGDVANFFRVAKHRPAELAEMFEREVVHAERFRELRAAKQAVGRDDDELVRAHRFAYLVWYSYGAKGQHFACSTAEDMLSARRGMRRPLDQVRELLDATAERLRSVQIEQRDFAEVLTRYDSPETWFYLDPPYVAFGNIAAYAPLGAERREALFAQLATLRGRWLMSFDDHAEVRALAKQHGFRVQRVAVTYSLTHVEGSRTKRGEVLISPARS